MADDTLRAPPEADALERAWKHMGYDRPLPAREEFYSEWLEAETLARALTEYGDQRVSEAIAMTTSAERIQAYGDQRAREAEKPWIRRATTAVAMASRVQEDCARQIREARAAAIEEAAQVVEDDQWYTTDYGAGAELAKTIRALADATPQSEPDYPGPDDLAPVREIYPEDCTDAAPPQSEGGEG